MEWVFAHMGDADFEQPVQPQQIAAAGASRGRRHRQVATRCGTAGPAQRECQCRLLHFGAGSGAPKSAEVDYSAQARYLARYLARSPALLRGCAVALLRCCAVALLHGCAVGCQAEMLCAMGFTQKQALKERLPLDSIRVPLEYP